MDLSKRKGRSAFVFNLAELTMLGVWIRWPLLQHAYDYPELYPDYYAEYSQALLYIVLFFSVFSLLLTHIITPGKAKPYQLNAESTFCQRCSIDRAPRAHHCSTCQSCILRLDHHCIWVHNCVGLYNIKYFYLYLVSISVMFPQMGTLSYDYYFLCYTFTFNSPDYLQSVLIKIGFYITGLICLMFTFGIFFLIYFQFNALYSNITSVEVIKGIATIRSRPLCLQFEAVHSSEYDMGIIGNFIVLMGRNPLLWCLPIHTYEHRYESSIYSVPTLPIEIAKELEKCETLDEI